MLVVYLSHSKVSIRFDSIRYRKDIGSPHSDCHLCFDENHNLGLIKESREIRRGDKSLAFPISYFPICSTKKKFFLDGLKKSEQRSHKCVELRGEYVE
jgi:hypothetical protein